MELCPLPADREGHATRNPHPRWSLKAGLWDDYGKCVFPPPKEEGTAQLPRCLRDENSLIEVWPSK